MSAHERDALVPYVPRLALEWLGDDAETRHRSIEGTLAFCDLSGFTAMSEKLAGLGRLGAEELSEIINRIFAKLLDEAASFGGAMVKYGGDAVLVFFSGDDHELRGLTATCRMRAALRDVGRVTTSQGRVRVRMSSGLHTGRFDYFLVGESHRELVITGAGATVTCAMEGTADAGEIVVSHALAERLPPALLGAPKGDGVLIARSPRGRASTLRAFPPPPEVDPTPLVPVALRRHLEATDPQPEHRHATIAFVAFGHVDEMIQGDGPEAAANALDAFMARAQAAAGRYGVSLMASDVYGNGGKIILTAGAPAAWENNDERVLRTVRDLMDAEDRLPLHIGVARGYVFAGDVGPAYRRTYTILGDAVNTAARVMASCGDSREVRVTPEVLARAESVFEVEERPPFAAKGKTLPIETLALGKRLGTRADIAPVAFVGRNAEVAQLKSLIDEARRGSRVVEVTGDAGVGKSRLLGEALAGEPFVWTRADAFESDVPYAGLFSVVGELVSSDVDAGAAATRLVAAVDALGPASAVVIDDAHHLDDASRDALERATSQLTSEAAFVLVHREHPGSIFADALALTLEPLSSDEAERLARLADPALLPGVARRLAQRSAGNPMFLVELVSAARRGEALADSIETAVAERIDALDTQPRELLRTASVLGESFTTGELRELASTPGDLDLSSLRPFLVSNGERLTFRQALFHDVAYAGLTYRRRRALHLAAGRALEASATNEAVSAILGRHFYAGGDWDKAWRYARAAGAQAYRTTYKAIAAAHLGRAVDAGTRSGAPAAELAETAADWGQALFFAGRTAEALTAYRKARRFARGDVPCTADVIAREAVLLFETDDGAGADRRFRRALRMLADYPPGVATSVRVTSIAGLLASRTGRRNPRRVAELVAEAARVAAFGAPADRARAHDLVAFEAFAAGRPRAAAAAAAEAAAAFGEAGFRGSRAHTLTALGAFQYAAGELEQAAAAAIEACELARTVGNETTELLALANLGAARGTQGRAEAIEILDGVLPAARTSGDLALLGFALAERIHAGITLGDDWPSLEALLCEAEEVVARGGIESAADVAAARAALLLTRGDASGALAALEAADGAGWALVPIARAVASQMCGATDEERRIAKDLVSNLGDPNEANRLLGAIALALLGRHNDAEELLAELQVERLPGWLDVRGPHQ